MRKFFLEVMPEKFLDDKGYIFHIQRDGSRDYGDCLQRTGFVSLGLFQEIDKNDSEKVIQFIESYNKTWSSFWVTPTEPTRYPGDITIKTDPWWEDLETVTRDQIIPNLCCLVDMELYGEVDRLYNILRSRGFAFWNNYSIWDDPDTHPERRKTYSDLAGVVTRSVFSRGNAGSNAWIYLGDVAMATQLWWLVFWYDIHEKDISRASSWKVDGALNLWCCLFIANKVKSTWLSRRLFKKYKSILLKMIQVYFMEFPDKSDTPPPCHKAWRMYA